MRVDRDSPLTPLVLWLNSLTVNSVGNWWKRTKNNPPDDTSLQNCMIQCMSALGPGCVKTPTPRPSAQQLNPDGNVGDTLLRRRPNSRLNISSRSPKNSFDTAWVISRHFSHPQKMSAFGGKADVIRGVAECPLIAATSTDRCNTSAKSFCWCFEP